MFHDDWSFIYRAKFWTSTFKINHILLYSIVIICGIFIVEGHLQHVHIYKEYVHVGIKRGLCVPYRHQWNLRDLSSLAPGRWSNFRCVIFEHTCNLRTHIADVHGRFMSNCSQVNATKHLRWEVNIVAGNGFVSSEATGPYMSQCWPRSISPYGVTRP